MLNPSIGTSRILRTLGALLLMFLVAACGGSSGSPGGGAGSDAGGGRGSGDGPDTSAVEQKFLDNLKLSTEDMARFTEFKESGRQREELGGAESCVVSFTGVIEFTGTCGYHGQVRKPGERVTFEAEVEYLKDQKLGWRQVSSGFYPH